jgi:hypothetical protein
MVAATGWLVFLALAAVSVGLAPALAGALRRALPRRAGSRHGESPLASLESGIAPQSRRSPRHAVRRHRGLVGSFFLALIALFLLIVLGALGELGLSVIPATVAFVLPTLLVILHARRRSERA